MDRKIQQLMDFVIEVDRVKHIVRKTKLFDGSRQENDAEHSWTICVMALIFRDYASVDIDLLKVLKMLLIHDIVEIDAGDVFLYDNARKDIHIEEEKAAKRIFGMLPEALRDEFLDLWCEFEERTTPEAKYAAIFDRLEPLYQNYMNKGQVWRAHQIKPEQVLEKNKIIQDGSDDIWVYAKSKIHEAQKLGYFDSI